MARAIESQRLLVVEFRWPHRHADVRLLLRRAIAIQLARVESQQSGPPNSAPTVSGR